MSFDNNYPNRKDNRRKYYSKAKNCDRSCRNHGSCSYCRSGRLYQYNKEKFRVEDELKEFYSN